MAATSTLALGVYLYYITTSNANRLTKASHLSGFVDWNDSQEQKEKVARAWMEKYVRNILLKRDNSSGDNNSNNTKTK